MTFKCWDVFIKIAKDVSEYEYVLYALVTATANTSFSVP